MKDEYDAIVVGGGHNGLTAAGYLGKSGFRTVVLERRPVVGGAVVTEEIHPGYRISTVSSRTICRASTTDSRYRWLTPHRKVSSLPAISISAPTEAAKVQSTAPPGGPSSPTASSR